MPIAITEEQRALQAAVRDWAKSVDPIAAVRRLEPATGADAAGTDAAGTDAAGTDAAGTDAAGPAGCWAGLAELGVFSIALPAAAGGADGTVADLAAALEQVTAALIPGPVMPTLLAGLVLGGQQAGVRAAARAGSGSGQRRGGSLGWDAARGLAIRRDAAGGR